MKYVCERLAIFDCVMETCKYNAAHQHTVTVYADACCFCVFVSTEITESMYMQNK